MKDQEVFNLHKIPESVLLKELRIEIGKLNSYIEELKFENKKLSQENESLLRLSKDERKELKVVSAYKEQNQKISVLEKEIHRLKKDKENIIEKLIQLQIKQ